MRPTGSLGNNFIIFKQERNEREGECSFAFKLGNASLATKYLLGVISWRVEVALV